MKKQYMAAVVCIVAGAIGFAGVYASGRIRSQREETAQNIIESQAKETNTAQTSSVVQPKSTLDDIAKKAKDVKREDTAYQKDAAREIEKEETVDKMTDDKQQEESPKTVETAKEAKSELHFSAETAIAPIKGSIILPYSMDKTIYFQTLDQYKYNPAVIVQAEVNDKVCFIAKGNITNITENEETGCTITQDLGDGYTAIYGQLKDINVQVGDSVESGLVAGYICQPTKYYSLEGSNLFFQMLKDGQPINPTEYLDR